MSLESALDLDVKLFDERLDHFLPLQQPNKEQRQTLARSVPNSRENRQEGVLLLGELFDEFARVFGPAKQLPDTSSDDSLEQEEQCAQQIRVVAKVPIARLMTSEDDLTVPTTVEESIVSDDDGMVFWQNDYSLHLSDGWIYPVSVFKKPAPLVQSEEKWRVRRARNFLLVSLMSIDAGYGAVAQQYQRSFQSGTHPSEEPLLSACHLTLQEVLHLSTQQGEADRMKDFVRKPPGPTRGQDLKMHHVMNVRQSLQTDLAEHSYQLTCRVADWSCTSFSCVPMQFEPVELYVLDALGQQEVQECFQQLAKAIAEDVSVMRDPQAQDWIQAVLDETVITISNRPTTECSGPPAPTSLKVRGLNRLSECPADGHLWHPFLMSCFSLAGISGFQLRSPPGTLHLGHSGPWR